MDANQNVTHVRGSERIPLHGAYSLGPVPEDERFEITVRIRRKAPLQSLAAEGFHADRLPRRRRYLTHDQYAESHGADPMDMAKVVAFAQAHDLVVVDSDTGRRSVFLSGTAADFSRAFGTAIEHYEHEGGTYRGRTGPLTMPAELTDIVEGVFGIDDRPVAKPHLQCYRPLPSIGIQAHAAGNSFSPTDLAKLYNFPTGLDGRGQCIAIIELGGGYRKADIRAYFEKLGLPVPKIKTVRVNGGRNQPSTADSADSEVMLDIEVAAAIAPEALIAVYFAPNTDKGFLDAITRAIHDKVHKPSVISISWGSAEKNWTAQSKYSFDQAFQAAASLGITICCASGDNGSGDGETDGKAHVDFPASSPHVLACGGTMLTAANGAISSEQVWNEGTNSSTGGGVSDFFVLPDYQSKAGIPSSANDPNHFGRGLPDVAGDADPMSGYSVRVDGQEFVIGGTSAVAPLWAGLIALINQRMDHRVGFLNPMIYGSLVDTGSFQDISTGNNGAYSAGPGWDACTGWGTPNGTRLLQALLG